SPNGVCRKRACAGISFLAKLTEVCPLLVLTRRELVYSITPTSEGRAVAAHRFNRVVVGRSRRKVRHIYAVDHVREILIPPVGRFCPATEVLGVRAVVHHRVLHQAAASIGRPPDNGGI